MEKRGMLHRIGVHEYELNVGMFFGGSRMRIINQQKRVSKKGKKKQ
jgi:hypothetical protein